MKELFEHCMNVANYVCIYFEQRPGWGVFLLGKFWNKHDSKQENPSMKIAVVSFVFSYDLNLLTYSDYVR